MAATEPIELNFEGIDRDGYGREIPKFKTGRNKSVSAKQLRARARRKVAKGKSPGPELELLYKPIEEWDREELARGRPRASDGTFGGRPPTWVSRELYEQALDRFKDVIRHDIHTEAEGALDIVNMLIHSTELDEKGKPIVSASVKADLAKWLVEHIVGKPTQRVETDISVKLQAVLAQSMLAPGQGVFTQPVRPVLEAPAETRDDVWDAETVDD